MKNRMKNQKTEPSGSQSGPQSLTERLVAMDHDAWGEAVDKYRPMLIRLGCADLSKDEAEDLADEVILVTWKYFQDGRFEHRAKNTEESDGEDDDSENVKESGKKPKSEEDSEKTFVGWLCEVHRNRMYNLFKRASRKRRIKSGEESDMMIRNLQMQEKHSPLTTWLSALDDSKFSNQFRILAFSYPTKVWTAFFRTHDRNLSADTVAEQLGVTREDVYNFNRRVKRKLEKIDIDSEDWDE